MDRLAGASAVYVGESHDQAAHHEMQRRVLEAIALRPGGPMALGLEMFSLPQQPHLDAFNRGEIDEEGLHERSEWAKRWGFGWEMYRPLFTTARAHNVALVALNAPREVTRKISRGGLAGLTPAEQATLPALDLQNAAHRTFVRDAFGAHGASMKAAVFERFYTAQVVWDETMAETVARWLIRNGPDARMVVVAGNGHVADRFGIPARAEKRTGRPYLTVVQEVVDPSDPPDEPPRTDVRYADYTAWWAPSAPPRHPDPPKAPAPSAAPPAPEAPKQE